MKKNWFKRFTVLALVGSLLCGALVAGCGGGEEDDTATNANNAGGAGGAGGGDAD